MPTGECTTAIEEISGEEFLRLLAERAAEADRQDAPLLVLQTAEDAMVDAGEIDPNREYLAEFGLDANGVFRRRIAPRPPDRL